MTLDSHQAGAAPNPAQQWKSINWTAVEREVRRLQVRIAKATKAGKWNKVRVLQRLLTRSRSAKLLAVKRVSSNKGSRTPGIDGVRWRSNTARMNAVDKLQSRGYKAQPLRRIKIPKKNGKWRLLGIPTMVDRAMQALYLLALEPISETTADHNSYGFRPHRACRDALGQCLITLSGKRCAKWILEGDIKACFDGISHQWLLDHIPLEKKILNQWLTSGYVEDNKLFPTTAGTPQGGICSPVLANMALDGLEAEMKTIKKRNKRSKINFIRYADDFIITASNREILENEIIPTIQQFLDIRGLQLSVEKTKVTHMRDGFDFLSCNVRKFGQKYQMTPAESAVKSLYEKVREVVLKGVSWKTENLIRKLNPILRGWANYHRYGLALKAFEKLDWQIHELLLRVWAKRRHPNKSIRWKLKRYFRISRHRDGTFYTKVKGKDGKSQIIALIRLSTIPRYQYIKIRGKANPYDPSDNEYFQMRKTASNVRPMSPVRPITTERIIAGFA